MFRERQRNKMYTETGAVTECQLQPRATLRREGSAECQLCFRGRLEGSDLLHGGCVPFILDLRKIRSYLKALHFGSDLACPGGRDGNALMDGVTWRTICTICSFHSAESP